MLQYLVYSHVSIGFVCGLHTSAASEMFTQVKGDSGSVVVMEIKLFPLAVTQLDCEMWFSS